MAPKVKIIINPPKQSPVRKIKITVNPPKKSK